MSVRFRGDLPRILRDAPASLPRKLKKLDRDTALKVLRDCKARTPVLTGRARDGWKLSGTTVSSNVDYILALEGRVGIMFDALGAMSPKYYAAIKKVIDREMS